MARIYIDTPICPATARDLNVLHGNMPLHIEQAYPQSEAIKQVATAQYADALAKMVAAIYNVLAIQCRTVELAVGNAPMPELENLKDELGL